MPSKKYVLQGIFALLALCSLSAAWAAGDAPAKGGRQAILNAAAGKGSAGSEAAPNDPVIMRVNGKPVTQGELDQVEAMIKMRKGGGGPMGGMTAPGAKPSGQEDPKEAAENRESAKKQIIDMHLMKDAIGAHEGKVTEAAVNAEIAKVDKKIQAEHGKTLKDLLAMRQMTMEDFKENMRESLAFISVLEEQVGPVNPSDEEVKQAMDASKNVPAPIRASHILLGYKNEGAPAAGEKDALKKKAEKTLKRVKAGEDFAKLANELTTDPTNQGKGGDLNFFPPGRMVPPFDTAAFKLKPGEVSGVVETQYGYHIIKRTDDGKQAAKAPSVDDIRDRLRAKKLNANVPLALAKLRSTAKVEDLDGTAKNAPAPAKK